MYLHIVVFSQPTFCLSLFITNLLMQFYLRCRATGRVQKREKQRWFAFLYIFYNKNSIINKEKN